jgi:hypothetical protein
LFSKTFTTLLVASAIQWGTASSSHGFDLEGRSPLGRFFPSKSTELVSLEFKSSRIHVARNFLWYVYSEGRHVSSAYLHATFPGLRPFSDETETELGELRLNDGKIHFEIEEAAAVLTFDEALRTFSSGKKVTEQSKAFGYDLIEFEKNSRIYHNSTTQNIYRCGFVVVNRCRQTIYRFEGFRIAVEFTERLIPAIISNEEATARFLSAIVTGRE